MSFHPRQRILQKGSSHRFLEGGDRTVVIRESGSEMSDDLCLRTQRGCPRRIGRWAVLRQRRADGALGQDKSPPNALQGSVTERGVEAAHGRNPATADGLLKKLPERVGGQTQPSDLIGSPDTECPSTAPSRMAVAAKDAVGPNSFSRGALVVIPPQKAVAYEHANDFAMRTRHPLEPFTKRNPLLLRPPKPSHARTKPPAQKTCQITMIKGAGYSGV